MTNREPRIAIIGAGIGGLTAAATLRRVGFDVQIYEQAQRFARIGAGIQMSANAVRVLRVLDLEDHIRHIAFRPTSWANREWNSGKTKYELALGTSSEARYGAPYLLLHRGDLHAALSCAVPAQLIHMNKRLVGLEPNSSGISIRFADGSSAAADAVIGADGVHSSVRELLLGPEEPRFTGRVAYRTTFGASLLGDMVVGDCTKWWGPDRHIVIYYVTPNRDEIYFVTSQPEPQWRGESWSAKGDIDELRAGFEGFHAEVRGVLDACPDVHKWALYERDPLSHWCEGPVALLGDACHPMMPYMAQGAATAMEDAVVLSRCLEGVAPEGFAGAFSRYELARKERTSRIQLTSRLNEWMSKETEADWVYGYDAWTAPLG
ncbi:MAG: FAD-dependent monooxygenase [Betaproteobacteria bacterium]|nr:FAD-dependent monooxygenase [Betaproteobacteria bacterium]